MVDITYWMMANPATIAKTGTVYEAAKAMVDKGTDAIFVIENDKPIGIFTEHDLLRKVVAVKKNPDMTKIAEVMTSPIQTLPKTSVYTDVLTLMKTKNYRHMPIVDEAGKIIGLVTLQNLLKK